VRPQSLRVLPLVACLALAVPAVTAAATGETRATAPLFGNGSPRFGADLRAHLTAQGTALTFDLECPYSELSFIRIPAGYGAALRVTVVFRTSDEDQAGGDVGDDRIVVSTFEATRDPASRARFRRSFRLAPGEYAVEVTVEDLNGGRQSAAKGEIRVPAFDLGGLGLGDLEFGFCATESTFVPLPSRRYEADLDRLCVRGIVYDRRVDGGVRPVQIAYEVRSEGGETLVRGDTTTAVARESEFVLRPRVGDLFLGTYALHVEAREGERRWRAERSFEVETLTLPRGQNYATVVEIVSYVAADAEYDELRRAKTDAERQVAWDRFWSRRDPSPDTPRNEAMIEFFRRVRFANRNFAGQSVAGWRTDQGRIYIRHGAPDQIEERPATFYEPPVQIWHYYQLNRRFVFADREGFGRYELVYPGGDR
jgi:GWxTD domain-containing protein